MTGIKGRPRIAVISPFLDRQHGTERCVVEQLEGLADDFEFHVYSARIADLNLGKIVWHRIPSIPGPHVVKYLWFFLANRASRWLDRHFRGAAYDLIYSPGINCFDAELIAVHIVFAEFYERARESLGFGQSPPSFWPRLLHRKIFYRLIIGLERRIYTRKDLPLVAVSGKVRDDLRRFYRCQQNLFVVYNGIDTNKFNSVVRQTLRANARNTMGYSSSDFVLLLIGNDWNKKGLPCLLEAV
ncbi:MAG: glycosyltransferase, partial [Blastocatellia bacterium]